MPGAYIWITLIVAGMAMWTLAREWLPAAQASAAAVFFAVNPYNLAMVYYRSDFSELLGVALLPFMLVGALGAIRCDWRRMPYLAVVFAAIWLSSAPEGVIATYSLALLFLIAAMRQRNPRPLFLGTVAMIAGFGLAAFYLLPAAWERQLGANRASSHGKSYARSKIFSLPVRADPQFRLFNWKISGIAVGMMLVTGVAAVFASRHRRPLGEIWWMLLGVGNCSLVGHVSAVGAPSGGICQNWLFCNFPGDGLGRCRLHLLFSRRPRQSLTCSNPQLGGSRRRCCWRLLG